MSTQSDDKPNTEQTAGRIDQGAGAVKEVAGEKSGDEELERQGEADQEAGKATEKYGDKQEDAGKAGGE